MSSVIAAVVSAVFTVRLSTLELTGEGLSLSTLAELTAVPAEVAWKLPVAVPAACTVPCVLERLPWVAAQVTERPTISVRSATGTGPFAEFVRKLAVSDVDWFVTIGEVEAVNWSRYQGVKLSVPPAVLAASHGAAPGPVLQPHQLLVTVAVVASTLLRMPLPVGALFPAITDLDIVTLLLPTKRPPPACPAVFPVIFRCVSENGVVVTLVPSRSSAPPKEFVAVFPVNVDAPMVTVVPAPCASVARAPPMPAAALFVNVEPLIAKCPTVVGRK